MKIYCIKDNATEAYGLPFFVRAQGQAIRMFRDEANNEESQIKRNPQDFDLYYLGEYDDQTGQLTPATNIERVQRATDFSQE